MKLTDRLRASTWVTPESLNVAPALVGRPLATPQRRALAMLLDVAVVALLSGVTGFWLIGGLALVALQLRSRQGSGAGQPVGRRLVWGWILAAVLGLLALDEAKTRWDERHGPPPAAALAEHGDDESRAAAGAAVSASSAMPKPGLTDAERIAQLEAELKAAKKPKPFKWRHELNRLIDAAGLQFGWGFVYFSLLPAWWGGQTVGKKIFGLQVQEITGKPMTVMRCLKRYGGYAAGMATGGIGLAQLLWDANRQGIQDKAAHTVVIDLRAPHQPPPQPQPVPEAEAEATFLPPAAPRDAT
jgi:uncharacterized RDD family membrane protein YckC